MARRLASIAHEPGDRPQRGGDTQPAVAGSHGRANPGGSALQLDGAELLAERLPEREGVETADPRQQPDLTQ